MSLSLAPVPEPPLPWENTEYEDNVSIDDEYTSDHSYITLEGYESDDSLKSICTPTVKFRNPRRVEPVPYYKSILQEEEYFSE